MNGLPVDELQKAEALVLEGRLQEARPILVDFIRSHAESADGWFLLSFVAPEHTRQVECLERALKLDPQMSRASLRLEQLTQPADLPKVSPFFENDFNFSEDGAFQPAPQAPKSWFDDRQAPQLIVPLEGSPQPALGSYAPLQSGQQEGAEVPAVLALEKDTAALDSDQPPPLPEVEELVDMTPPERKPEAGQLTRDQKIWLWVLVIIFFLVLLSFGMLYIANLAVLPPIPPTIG